MVFLTRLYIFCALYVAFLWPVHNAEAATPIWVSSRYQYAADGKPLREVLRDFASSQGMAYTMSSDIDGVVAGKFDVAPENFLDTMAHSYGFLWYFDGAVLHIVTARDIQTRVLKLSASSTKQLQATLARMGLLDTRFPLKYDELTNTAIAQGPVPYVSMVVEMAARIEAHSIKQGTAEIRVFPLHNVWATDHSGDNPDSLPVRGVVALLRDLYPRSQADSSGIIKSNAKNNRSMARLAIGDSLAPFPGLSASNQLATSPGRVEPSAPWSGLHKEDGSTPQAVQTALRMSDTLTPETELEDLPVFQADAENNAVVIRDLPEHMAQYERFINQMDLRAAQLEVEVQIIEIQTDALQELGINWRLHTGHIDAQTGSGVGTQPGFNGALSGTADVAQAAAKGGMMTAVLGNAGQYLLAQVSALMNQGRARIVARPKVTTINHHVALMSSLQTMHVKVEGYQSAQLFALQAGTQMRVTPSAYNEDGLWRIRLDVSVQDGRIMDQKVGDIPVIVNNRIDTQAVITNGESLLMAGYTLEQESNQESGIPVLSDLPILGQLFRYNRKENKGTVRVFLVSPKILS